MQIWDLRKTKKTLEVVPFDEGIATCATFDHSGKYLVRFWPFVPMHAELESANLDSRAGCANPIAWNES